MKPLSVIVLASFFGVALPSPPLAAADHSLEPLKEGSPAEVAADLRKTLAGEGIRVLDRKKQPLADIWFRKEIPSQPEPAVKPTGVKLLNIAEGSFVGVIRYHQAQYDFKDKKIPAGLYTLRNGIQPMDGDHLGVSFTRDFAMLAPAKDDTKLDPMPTQKLAEMSAKVSGTKHPSVLYLTPMAAKEPASFPALVHDEEHDWQIIDFRIPLAGEKDKHLRMGLVVVGIASEL